MTQDLFYFPFLLQSYGLLTMAYGPIFDKDRIHKVFRHRFSRSWANYKSNWTLIKQKYQWQVKNNSCNKESLKKEKFSVRVIRENYIK